MLGGSLATVIPLVWILLRSVRWYKEDKMLTRAYLFFAIFTFFLIRSGIEGLNAILEGIGALFPTKLIIPEFTTIALALVADLLTSYAIRKSDIRDSSENVEGLGGQIMRGWIFFVILMDIAFIFSVIFWIGVIAR